MRRALAGLLLAGWAAGVGVFFARLDAGNVPAVALPAPVVRVSRPKPRPTHFVVTAYCACSICTKPVPDGITASGRLAREGRTVAADWSVLRPGTWVKLPGLGWRVVEDKGGAIRGAALDVYMESHEQALQFGRRVLRVEVRTNR